VKHSKKTKDQLMKEMAKMRQRMRRFEAKEKKWGQEKLKTQNVLRDLRSSVDAAKDLILVLDTKFRIMHANLATSRFLKKPINKIVGKTCYRQIHEIDFVPRECPLNVINHSKKHEEAECYLSAKDMWLQVSSDPIFDENGKMVRIVHMLRDITEFRRTEALLRESERRFRTIFDYANHGIHLIDMTERKTFMVNKTLCQMLGYSKEEFKQLTINDIYPQKDLPYIMANFRKILREEIDIEINISLLRKDGSFAYVHASAAPFALGGKTHLMCVFRETGEQKTS
jgi:PAS domain S-box-containing protein